MSNARNLSKFKPNTLGLAEPDDLAQPLTLGTSQATTSGTSKDFTGIPSWVKRITVVFSQVSLSGSANTMVQIGSGSFTTSGYAYFWSATQTGSLANYISTAGFVADGGTTTVVFSGTMVLSKVTGNTWVATGLGGGTNSGNYRSWQGGGDVSLSGALDRIRITTVNGTDTFDAGSINILYE